MDRRVLLTFLLLFSTSKSFNTIRLISDEGITEYDLDKTQDCFVSGSQYLCPSLHIENGWDLFQDEQFLDAVLSLTDGVPKLYNWNNGQMTETGAEIKVEFVDNKSDSLGTTEQKGRKVIKMKFLEIYNFYSN